MLRADENTHAEIARLDEKELEVFAKHRDAEVRAFTRATGNKNGRTGAVEETQSRKKAGKKSERLSPAKKAKAKRAVKRAGRRYPNLVDTVNAAKANKKKETGER